MTRSALCILFLLSVAAAALAGPGHDHGAATSAIGASIPRLESASGDLELVATAEGQHLTIYLDRVATNEPIDGASIEVSGDGVAAVAAKPLGDGVYIVEADWVDAPGTKALVFTVVAGETSELLNGTLDVAAIDTAATAKPLVFTDFLVRADVWILAFLAAAFGFVLSFAFRPVHLPPDAQASASSMRKVPLEQLERHARQAAEIVVAGVLITSLLTGTGLAGPGHDHGDGGHDAPAAQAGGNTPSKLPEGDVFLPKPSQRLLRIRTTVAARSTAQTGTELVGTVIPDPSTEGRVQAPMDGQIDLASSGVAFVGQTVKAGDVLAALTPSIPVFDRGSLQQLTAEVEGKLKIAEQKLSRLTSIAGVVAQRDIDDTRVELEALREQQRVLAPKNAEKIALKAPVSGIISVAGVRAGQVVNARDTLFEIVDPQRLWVEAIGTAGHEGGDITAAHALDAEGHTIPLRFVGQAPTLRQQGMPLLFNIEHAHDALSIGASVRVIIQRGTPVEGIVLPEDSVVRGLNGLPQVWTKISAERFKPVPVRTSALDGARVLVTAGVDKDSRVVTEGAEFINQVR